MMKETFKTNLLIPKIKVLFEAQFKKSKKSNDIQNIFIIHLLYNREKYINYTITDFIRDITGIKREKLLEFALAEFIKLINNKVILYSNATSLSIKDIKKMYINQLGINDRIIHPKIEKEFNRDNFIGLDSKTIKRNLIFIKNLVNLKEEIIDNNSNEINNDNNENYIFIDSYNIFSNTYDSLLESSIKTKFEDNEYINGEYFTDYKLNNKNKNEYISKVDDIFWSNNTFNFIIEDNAIIANDLITRDYLKKVSGLNIDNDTKPILEIKNFIKLILNIDQIKSLENDFELKTKDKNIFSVNLNNEIIKKQWTNEEKDITSLLGKKVFIDKDKNIFFIYLSEFQIDFYDLNDKVIGFTKELINPDKLFELQQNIALEKRRYSTFVIELLIKNINKIINNSNFNDWFLENLSLIEKLEYDQAKNIINKIPFINSQDILEILSKTNEFKNNNFKNISKELYSLLLDNNFNEWNKLNDRINYEYDGYNYLFW
ncbi:hypothetical protein [Mycoplasma sp. CSL7503-lung]|uniref:hypothetical protein n=1 Tax=Mycoplasma sp. CSL7503-lung TaxID=536372 RepID=UPI0021CF54A9|nr:hypothetical protein [Mycoplasma sp. CSL7503-lung]MCU4706351.1 hypothetical protein [Mycoplasma sp. CSL7503-lung]